MIFAFETRVFIKLIDTEVANSFCLSPVINSHTTEHESKRRAVQENSIGVDYFSDGKEQVSVLFSKERRVG